MIKAGVVSQVPLALFPECMIRAVTSSPVDLQRSNGAFPPSGIAAVGSYGHMDLTSGRAGPLLAAL